jgi:hypothetical protein
MQPQPYWKTNHLLMRIWDDTKQDVAWVDGDTERKADWEELNGKAEFQDNEIYLTCEPDSVGTLRLNDSDNYKDVIVSTRLTGNKIGAQSVYLRAGEDLQDSICVRVDYNELYIIDGGEVIYQENLDKLTEEQQVSVEEDDLAAQIAEKELEVQYATTVQKSKDAAVELAVLNDETPLTVEDGAEEYVEDIQLKDPGDRQLWISLKDNLLTVSVDGYYAVQDQEIHVLDAGSVLIQSGCNSDIYSQRNLTDDVYDGVFVDFLVTENTGADKEAVLYDDKLHGLEKVRYQGTKMWKALLNWFIDTF